jgi:hypothetical protein
MLSKLANNLNLPIQSLILTPTRLEDNFKNNKNKDHERTVELVKGRISVDDHQRVRVKKCTRERNSEE